MAKLHDLRTLIEQSRTTRGEMQSTQARARPDPREPVGAKARNEQVHRQGHKALPGDRFANVHREPAASGGEVKRRLAATKHAHGDIDIAQAFADVHRLPPRNRADVGTPRPAPVPQQRLEDEADALEMSKYGAEPAPHSWDIGQELEGEQTFLRRGLGSDVLVKLRRGRWSVQAELDLHGQTAESARDTLADFLLDARYRGLRCVRVIHGKGLTSPNREPILKGRVRKWLAHWDDVLAYCEAPSHGGGGGAVLVLLRGGRS
ncbi:MAG TPA: Smr/MutS family protein [Casimicrobiaceae bacterium]|nr:Smr/MutS family protein [Casimicrobiaceae bacterium]